MYKLLEKEEGNNSGVVAFMCFVHEVDGKARMSLSVRDERENNECCVVLLVRNCVCVSWLENREKKIVRALSMGVSIFFGREKSGCYWVPLGVEER